MKREVKNMTLQLDQKGQDILAFLENGKTREEIAAHYGNSTWKSIDMYMRRRGFSWDSEAKTYVEEVENDAPSATEEAVHIHTKAAQIVRMLDVKHPDPRGVANKQGFETVDEMGEYMKSQGYIWSNKTMNYEYDEDIAPAKEPSDEELAVDGFTASHLQFLNQLMKHKDHFLEWVTYQENGRVPLYKFRGTPAQKTLTMTSSSVALLNDFGDEFSVHQKVIVEAALAEYFQKYGYGEQVKKATT